MAEYTIRGAHYYLNGAIGTIRIRPNQRPSFDPQGITKITFLPHTFQASYESGDWSSGVIVRVENLKNSYFRREVLKVLNLNEVLTNIYSGYSNGAVTIEYEERQVEWRRESETRYTEPTQTTRYDDSIYPSESYTEQGVRGRQIVVWEAEYVNGSATGNRRNEQTQTLVDMKPTVRVVGTKRDRIEWRTQSHTESITATQTERRDPNVYPEDSYVQQGRDGQKRITYERKYVNGERTEETRNRRESTIRDMQPFVRVIGTKRDRIEWRTQSHTESITATQTERRDPNVYPEDSYVQQGRDGQKRITYERKYVNGERTEETRNRRESTIRDMQPFVRVIGTKRDRIEWRQESEVETISATTTERRDPDIYPEDSFTEQGQVGQKRITYERKYVNGSRTEETRNRRVSTTRPMRPHVRVIGTKQRARYLVPRIIFNGKHAIRVVRDNEVVRSIDGLTDLPARQNYVNLSSKSSSGGWARYELTEEISNGLYDLTIETPIKTTVSVEFKVLTFWEITPQRRFKQQQMKR
ncbi:hypothetical protein BWX42_00580 [Dolosigranulum pigrum]|uniref:G5 domain-containing protein n=1 Tax=Dolosigranulum pigrum TaxID=29394 RepID=A0A1S8KLA4_9LACT|nr:hypothetical protein BWX42_00580 [Dolosigranulum pigrum]